MAPVINFKSLKPVQSSKHKYVFGPITLTEHYDEKYDKHIYIFGDRHSEIKPRPCTDNPGDAQMHIVFFIEQLIRENIKKGKQTDIFLEGLPKRGKIKGEEKPFTPRSREIVKSYSDNVGNVLKDLLILLNDERLRDIAEVFEVKNEKTIEKKITEYINKFIKPLDANIPQSFREDIVNIWESNYDFNTKRDIINTYIRGQPNTGHLSNVADKFRSYIHQTNQNDIYNFNGKARFHAVDLRNTCTTLSQKFVESNTICLIKYIDDIIYALFGIYNELYKKISVNLEPLKKYGIMNIRELYDPQLATKVVKHLTEQDPDLNDNKLGEMMKEFKKEYQIVGNQLKIIASKMSEMSDSNRSILNKIKELNIYSILKALAQKKQNDIIKDMESFLDVSGFNKELSKLQAGLRVRFTQKVDEFKQKDINIATEIIKVVGENISDFEKFMDGANDATTLKKSFEIIRKIKNHVGDFIIGFMDIYLLARVFKNPEFKHIIIYVGNNHAQYYRTFLKDIGFESFDPFNSQQIALQTTTKACVDVKPFEPFFEKN